MSIITIGMLILLVPMLILSFIFRNDPGSKFGPKVCSRCGVELRGWHSSGRKQVWYRSDGKGGRIYFCARCKGR